MGDKKALFGKKEEKKEEITSLANIKEGVNHEVLGKNLTEIEKEIAKCVTMIKEGKPFKRIKIINIAF